ncbi:MAG TPA: hypothetical protein VGG74_24585 [Kofleriaceae bacterium]|jgi:hypothetical protein
MPLEKDTVVRLRIASKEADEWKAAADAEDETLSNWIRRQIRAVLAAKKHKR